MIFIYTILGVICLMIAFWMLTDKVSTRIRRSRYWFFGWAGYMLLLVLASKLLMLISNKLPYTDDQMLPRLLGGMIILIVIVGMYQYGKIRSWRTKP